MWWSRGVDPLKEVRSGKHGMDVGIYNPPGAEHIPINEPDTTNPKQSVHSTDLLYMGLNMEYGLWCMGAKHID